MLPKRSTHWWCARGFIFALSLVVPGLLQFALVLLLHVLERAITITWYISVTPTLVSSAVGLLFLKQVFKERFGLAASVYLPFMLFVLLYEGLWIAGAMYGESL